VTEFSYSGDRIDFSRDAIDWGADYYVVTSSVIYMPMQFVGGQHHNLTKVLIEHGVLLASDFVLFVPYAGSYWLMQANNLDKIVIVVRSLGTETSNDRTAYSLTWLSSSQTLNGPYTMSSASSSVYVKNDKGTQTSSNVNTYTLGSSSSLSSPQIDSTVVADSSLKTSSTKQVYTINGTSQQSSEPIQLYTLNDTSSQDSSTKSTTVINDSSTINSSPTPIEVAAAIAGDINADGIVDIVDIVIVALEFGHPPPPIVDLRADVNKDGLVNIVDIVIVAIHFGETG
jgi:hypothetical protein